MHRDSDLYLESWTIREMLDLSEEQAPSLDEASPKRRRAEPHEANSGATILPLRGLAFFVRPDRDVAHAFFRHEEHGAWDSGAGAVRGGRGLHSGVPTAFHLQSGGCSDRRLRVVSRWVREELGMR